MTYIKYMLLLTARLLYIHLHLICVRYSMLSVNDMEYSCVAIYCKLKAHMFTLHYKETITFLWIRLLPLSPNIR